MEMRCLTVMYDFYFEIFNLNNQLIHSLINFSTVKQLENALSGSQFNVSQNI